MTAWGHSLPGHHVPLPEPYAGLVADRCGSALAVDITPAWSPHPGGRRLRSRRPCAGAPHRHGGGVPVDVEGAVDKAFLEWCQGVLFAGVFVGSRPGLRYPRPSDVRTFEDHAAHYTVHPDRWDGVPLLTSRAGQWPSPGVGLSGRGPRGRARLSHRRPQRCRGAPALAELTTPDLRQIISVVRSCRTDPITSTPNGLPRRAGRRRGLALPPGWRRPPARSPTNPHPGMNDGRSFELFWEDTSLNDTTAKLWIGRWRRSRGGRASAADLPSPTCAWPGQEIGWPASPPAGTAPRLRSRPPLRPPARQPPLRLRQRAGRQPVVPLRRGALPPRDHVPGH